MPRYTYVYPPDGSGPFLKGSPEHLAYLGSRDDRAAMVFGDEPDFVSPIDGKVWSGKAGMREHNRRHDVINNRDLVGLPTGISGQRVSTLTERRELRNTIIESARRRGHLEGQ